MRKCSSLVWKVNVHTLLISQALNLGTHIVLQSARGENREKKRNHFLEIEQVLRRDAECVTEIKKGITDCNWGNCKKCIGNGLWAAQKHEKIVPFSQ